MYTSCETNKIKFMEKLEQIRTTKEQVDLQKQAANKVTKSNLVTLLLVMTLASIVLSFFLNAHWIVYLGTGALAIYLYILSNRFALVSLILAKEQDRKYVMACFREAQNIDEMNWAGWFQYLPEMEVKTGFDQRKSDETAVKEINRMRDVFSKKSSFEERLKDEEESKNTLNVIQISNSAGRADFFDASALVKLYVEEDSSEKVRTHFHNSPTKCTTPFCFYEALSVLKGKWGRKELTRDKYLDVASRLTAWYSASSCQITDLNFTDPDIFKSARSIVEEHNIDLSDAFQILSVKQGYFSRHINDSQTLLVTADKKLAKAARSLELRVWSVLEEDVIAN